METAQIKRILVVDDELSYRAVVSQMLRKFGYDVETSAAPADAYEKVMASDFDVVLSDIRMDGGDGLQLMRKCLKSRSELDFIIMTAHSADYSYKDIIDAGAADFIAKPFISGELEAKLDRLAHEKRTLSLLEEAKRQLERSNIELQQTLMGTVKSLASAISLKDPYTAGHQDRVADLSRAVAERIGLDAGQVKAVHVAGILHDIGKISVPSEILSKPTRLKPAEMDLVRDHPRSGHEIIAGVNFPWPIAEIILQHHERLDGSGYPQGIKGNEILPAAKIIAVADVVEAMMSHRPYRAALGLEMALGEISGRRGILYDPVVVDACVELFAGGGFNFGG